jgi:hypothetical protein
VRVRLNKRELQAHLKQSGAEVIAELNSTVALVAGDRLEISVASQT